MSEGQNDEPATPIRVDDRFEVYASFFDHAWSRRIRDLVQGTKLSKPTFSLCMNWKAIANTHRFPWLMIECLKSQMQVFLRKHEPLAVAVSTAIESRLLQVMRDDLPESARQKLRNAVREIAEAASAARDDSDATWPENADLHWNKLFPDQEFVISIWGSQRICYAALYHAFEDFARQCIGLAAGHGDDGCVTLPAAVLWYSVCGLAPGVGGWRVEQLQGGSRAWRRGRHASRPGRGLWRRSRLSWTG